MNKCVLNGRHKHQVSSNWQLYCFSPLDSSLILEWIEDILEYLIESWLRLLFLLVFIHQDIVIHSTKY
jgi:hypothetical protein